MSLRGIIPTASDEAILFITILVKQIAALRSQRQVFLYG